MLYDLFLLLFLLSMIPLPLYSSGFTGGKLVITNNWFNTEMVVIRKFICFFANIVVIFLKLK